MPQVPDEVEVAADCPEPVFACAWEDRVYLSSSAAAIFREGPTYATYVLWHEYGHVADLRYASDADHSTFLALMSLPANERWEDPIAGQPNSARELWADTLAVCSTFPHMSVDGHGYGWQGFGPARTETACAWFAEWLRTRDTAAAAAPFLRHVAALKALRRSLNLHFGGRWRHLRCWRDAPLRDTCQAWVGSRSFRFTAKQADESITVRHI
jgi:hypothetical protein